MGHVPSELLRLRGVTRSFELHGQAVDVLRGVDLHVEPGDVVGIEGVSGAGKSTLLHILAMVDLDFGGTYQFLGRDPRSTGERERASWRLNRVGMAFQNLWLVDSLTARENLLVPLYAAGVPETQAKQRADELLLAAGLEAVADHRPSELSGGERRRVALSRALTNRPGVLLVDEPTAELDATSAAAVRSLLERARSDGATLVMATHDPLLLASCSRRFHLAGGRLSPSDASGP